MDKNGSKVILVVILLAAAGGIAAWQLGLFGGSGGSKIEEMPEGYNTQDAIDEQQDLPTPDERDDGEWVSPPLPPKPR